MDQEIQLFQLSEDGDDFTVRTIQKDDKIWFVGKDVAKCLGYKTTTKHLKIIVNQRG